MKNFTPTLFASLALLFLSTVNAGPIPDISELAEREPLFVDSDNILDIRQLHDEGFVAFARDLDDGWMELYIRGAGQSKPKDPERKAKYPTGNPKPETPVGEFRPLTAGKKDDYFG